MNKFHYRLFMRLIVPFQFLPEGRGVRFFSTNSCSEGLTSLNKSGLNFDE